MAGYDAYVKIRDATVGDAEAIAAIYNHEVLTTTHTFDLIPRTTQEQRRYIEDRSGVLAVLVVEDDSAIGTRAADTSTAETGTAGTNTAETAIVGRDAAEAATKPKVSAGIVAFGSLSHYRDRAGYRTSVENSIYVAPSHQRQGVGDALLAALIERATQNGFHSIFARIVDAQTPSVALHERHGYQLIGVEREVGRKFGRWLDVALMQRLLSDPDPRLDRHRHHR